MPVCRDFRSGAPVDAPAWGLLAGGLAALVLEGEAGIGKSTLWLAGVEAAERRGLRVLASRPAEAERGLAHAALSDLFEGVFDSVAPMLVPPRRRALEVALLIEVPDHRLDPRTLAVAVRSALEGLAAEGPVVLAVDDVQWLDPSSAGALAFALRRLEETPVLLLLARRLGAEPSELERALEPERVERLRVAPLSLGAIQKLLQTRSGRAFARPTLLRIREASGGNPFYALELARALERDVDATEPLRVPETLEGLVRTRLDPLPKETCEALLLVAASGESSTASLRAAGVTEDTLEPALTAEVIELVDGAIRFSHPLLASVLYQQVSAGARRSAHELLATVVEDPLARARHLALATELADPGVAAALEEAAGVAMVRGAAIAAAELGEHALRLTPSDAQGDQHRRAIAAARAHLAGANVERARALAGDLLARSAPGARRAEILVLLGEAHHGSHIRWFREALSEAAEEPALQARIQRDLSWEVRFTEGLAVAEEHARASLALAEELDDDALRAGALAALAAARFHLGDPDALRLGEESCELVATAGDPE